MKKKKIKNSYKLVNDCKKENTKNLTFYEIHFLYMKN
jgi:hypothetical protein